MNSQNVDMLNFKDKSTFVGYEKLEEESPILAIFEDGKKVNSTSKTSLVVFESTPFYAESGGQVGDRGVIEINGIELAVLNTIKLPNAQHAMLVENDGEEIKVGDLNYSKGF